MKILTKNKILIIDDTFLSAELIKSGRHSLALSIKFGELDEPEIAELLVTTDDGFYVESEIKQCYNIIKELVLQHDKPCDIKIIDISLDDLPKKE